MRSLAVAALMSAAMAHAAPSAVPTYEAAGIYWPNPGSGASADGCEVRFRKSGDAAWIAGLNLWFDATGNECRGSIVGLAQDTAYEVQLGPSAAPAQALSFRTWPNRRAVAATITVQSRTATLDITQGGSPTGYVVYQGAPGAVLDANDASPFNVTVNASYVIVRGFTLRGAQRDAIRISPSATDVIIEDNDVSGWGRERAPGLGVDMDSGIRAVCGSPTLERVTIQRNRIHHPRYGANSWSDGHPAGPQAISFSSCGGNHVIRHNEIYSAPGRYFNDAIGGEDNFSAVGFPNRDSDIYGNTVSHAWDDGIEAEGADRNVRIWGNYIDSTAIGIATALATVGPVYMFRNVYNRSRELEAQPLDSDARQEMFKAGSDPAFADGRRYFFHNTMLQAVQSGAAFPLGTGYGISGSGASQPFNNAVSMNNIYHQWRDDWILHRQAGAGNRFAYDMYNGIANVPITGGIHAAPSYAPGNGWSSEANGRYALAAGSPGHDGAARIANFNDDFLGAAPDVGAHEAGAAAMKFGIAASPGSAAPASSARDVALADFNADGRPDIVWSRAADGATYLWYMNGPALLSDAFVTTIDPAWRVQAIADFDGDGHPDLVWRNAADGNTYVWYMDGASFRADAFLFSLPPQWVIQGLADFDRDAKPDFLLRNVESGNAFVWFFDNATPVRDQFLFSITPAWKVEAVADFDKDGQPDLLFRHGSSGLAFVWHTTYAGSLALGSSTPPLFSIDPAWEVAQAADWNGDGEPDLLFRNRTSGVVFVWYVRAGALAGSDFVTQVDAAWEIVP